MSLEKLPTYITGFDHIANGGLPKNRVTLLSGTAGSAKTVFACNFLAQGVLHGEAGVFVTFEEPPEDIRRNMLGFGWQIAQWEAENRWAFVDVSHPLDDQIAVGSYDFGGLLARIEYAVRRLNAKRLVMDSVSALFSRFADHGTVRTELVRLISAFKQLGLTALVTSERDSEYGTVARHGVEEFVADNVIILRNVLEDEKRRRTVEILKFRGATHQKGEFPFTVTPQEGIVVIPLSAIELKQQSSNMRISSGNPELDRMCGGGFFRDSIILVSGATGTGKTLVATTFLAGGAAHGERCLLFAFEESREQLFRNAIGWNVDFERMESEGLLRVVAEYPEIGALEEHLIRIKAEIAQYRPMRVAIDSLSALERIGTQRGFREFVISLTSFIKQQEIAGLFTATTPNLLGGTSITEAHISTITDSIILLRYVELYGEMRRGLTVLKMRGSIHDKDIREFSIDDKGMHIGKPFRNVSGILSGQFVYRSKSELDRLEGLFADDVEIAED
ncbi:MAG: circadian clock protein KaiC [Candidatus Thermofonsia Clade 1 bacterium]|jgi:circadian clock protein KaiC|uniref:non-specific serine/threonine protein kinase n=1 Tax=Candidatus Thermofonsia Clade 1 bacterium TaxID=2364210 RepID=A0A2M8PBM0_9CHLR|nr:MAG: circadian clock protein KaiC [Candidatus Thermofonsia Clade 1 bacterium]